MFYALPRQSFGSQGIFDRSMESRKIATGAPLTGWAIRKGPTDGG